MKYSLEIRTVQSAAIKTLVEALKELLTDVVLEADERGLRIIAMDTARVVLVHLRLDADRFEYYHCDSSLHLGINMINLHKLIKTVGNSDTLTLYVEADDTNHLGIKIDSSEKNSRTVYKLNLLDMESNSISVGPTQFEETIVLTASEFQKLCRDMHNLADAVEIKVVNDEVTFSCKGDFSTQETVLGNGCLKKNDAYTSETVDKTDIIQGIFSLKYLVMFTRCTNLSSNVELFLKNDYPLIVKYKVSSLGEIKLVCAPQANGP
ncbi:proliferating cell nuclear antigen [Tetraselmis virus 1]|uniref:Proliferating cell nuclear antigen n=1 Tax=Tetraselmis virus 1 TaxID=2060617 RepID=A0A2P0VPD8_9VIRU|nr:proliferating cell nuclear antigen [Tetraselmis virus 1]AUF82689.1 proliferating cell nuclear antigen [Tetraselmis virus 1]